VFDRGQIAHLSCYGQSASSFSQSAYKRVNQRCQMLIGSQRAGQWRPNDTFESFQKFVASQRLSYDFGAAGSQAGRARFRRCLHSQRRYCPDVPGFPQLADELRRFERRIIPVQDDQVELPRRRQPPRFTGRFGARQVRMSANEEPANQGLAGGALVDQHDPHETTVRSEERDVYRTVEDHAGFV